MKYWNTRTWEGPHGPLNVQRKFIMKISQTYGGGSLMTGCVKGSEVGGRTRKVQGTANKLLFKFSKISHLRRCACRGKGTARWSQSRRRSQRSWGWSPCDGPIFLEEVRCRRFWSQRRLHHTPRRIFLGPVVRNMLFQKKSLLETQDQVSSSTITHQHECRKAAFFESRLAGKNWQCQTLTTSWNFFFDFDMRETLRIFSSTNL